MMEKNIKLQIAIIRTTFYNEKENDYHILQKRIGRYFT